MTAPPGRLVLVATPIGNLGDLSPRAVETLAAADVVACEDTRHSGRLLAAAGIRPRRLVSFHAHNEAARTEELLALLAEGRLVAVVSDAGTPLLSDPGARLVAAAAGEGVPVSAVPGPSAALAALVCSGLDAGRWRFEGFLPRKGPERERRLARLATSEETTVCYESPRRLAATLADLVRCCGPGRKVAVARELTKLHEEVFRGTLAEALDRAGDGAPRGEHVLVVEAAPPREGPGAAELQERLARLVEAGLSRREAALAAEVLLGASHREAYAASLAAARHEPGSGGPPGAPVR